MLLEMCQQYCITSLDMPKKNFLSQDAALAFLFKNKNPLPSLESLFWENICLYLVGYGQFLPPFFIFLLPSVNRILLKTFSLPKHFVTCHVLKSAELCKTGVLYGTTPVETYCSSIGWSVLVSCSEDRETIVLL